MREFWALGVWLTAVWGLALLGTTVVRAATVGELRCEGRDNPLGIDVAQPRLSWMIESERRGEYQSAYQILVAASAEALSRDQGDLWDSGKVASSRSYGVEYAGKPLTSRTRCFWKVRVWDRDGHASPWSSPAHWSMGLLSRGDWKAAWIGCDAAYQPSPQQAKDDQVLNTQGLPWVHFPAAKAKPGVFEFSLRKQIEIPSDRKIRRAVVVLYAHNLCSVSVNQTAVGRSAWWEKTARIDVTPQFQPGPNVVALTVENTDFLPAAVIGQVVVQFESGDDLKCVIDKTWRAAQKPPAGWDKAGFSDEQWALAESTLGTPWGTPALNDIPRVPAPYLRHGFKIQQPVKHADVYVTALGCYELHLNGQRVGNDELTPGWTEYRKRVYYQTYDVTNLLKTGDNAIGAILGDGWYASDLAFTGKRKYYGGDPRLLVQLVVELADGSTQTVVSDGSWKAATGPIRHGDLLLGCEYDARVRMDGWDQPGFDEAAWQPVNLGAAQAEKVAIEAASAEALRRHEELPAIKVTQSRPGWYIFDLGQNMVGWTRLKIHGKPGQRITVRHGEMLNPDGTLYTANLRGATATDFFHPRRHRRRDAGAPLHVPWLPLRRSAGARLPAGTRRGDRHRRPHAHAAGGPFRMFQPAGQPALPQHHLGPERQLLRGADRLPAARRADGLDGRHAVLRPHGRLQLRRAGVLHPLAGHDVRGLAACRRIIRPRRARRGLRQPVRPPGAMRHSCVPTTPTASTAIRGSSPRTSRPWSVTCGL